MSSSGNGKKLELRAAAAADHEGDGVSNPTGSRAGFRFGQPLRDREERRLYISRAVIRQLLEQFYRGNSLPPSSTVQINHTSYIERSNHVHFCEFFCLSASRNNSEVSDNVNYARATTIKRLSFVIRQNVYTNILL